MRYFIVLALLVSSAQAADDFSARRDHNWHQWRGPLADGVAPHADPPVQWGEGQNVRWKVELPGEGSATPIIWEDQVFVLAAVPTDRQAETPPRAAADAKTEPPGTYYQFIVLCLDRATGAERWRQVACEEVPHEGIHKTNTYASGSPATDGRRLYAFFGSRGVFCLDLEAEGKILWRRDLGRLRTRFGWGEGASPALAGDTLVVPCDQEENSFITALNVYTGEDRWRVDRDEPTTWATPLIVERDGRRQAIINGTTRVRSYDLATGEVLWECGGQTVNAIPSPLIAGENAICVSGYRGAAAFAIPLDSEGDITGTDKITWSHHQGTPYVPSPIVVGGRLYFTAGNQDLLSCLDVASGQPIYERERLAGLGNVYASPVAAAGRIYFVGREGATVVIRDAAELEVLATNQLDDAIDASPAVAGKQLFLRGKRFLYCIQEDGAEEADATQSATGPVERAVAFLAREVPLWSTNNGCYSCHNNGDAARALYTATRLGLKVDPAALVETTAWLGQPDRWEHNGGEGPFVDKKLATIQFAWALAKALDAGAIEDRSCLSQAAELVAAGQGPDGSWDVVAEGTVGSPATYGNTLATAVAAYVLVAADTERYVDQVIHADRWLRGRQPKTVLDAAATLLVLAGSEDEEAAALREACQDLIGQGQHASGGWGPYVTSRPEPFDTALVLLALGPRAVAVGTGLNERMKRGRAYLVATQLDDGSWPETTRPAGAESYAQRISTTAWAAAALMEN